MNPRLRAAFSPRELLEKAAAVGLGLVFSLSLLVALEAGLRLNHALGWIDIKSIFPPKEITPVALNADWEGVSREALGKIHDDPFGGIWRKYGQRGLSERLPTAYLPNGEFSYRELKTAPDGETIFDVQLRYNYRQRRPTFAQPPNPQRSVFLVGCSLTLGEGVQENETIGSYLQTGFKDTAVESLAFHGWALGNHLNGLRDEIYYKAQRNPYHLLEKRPLIVVYVFIADHLRRTLCPLSCYRKENEWMLENPSYRVSRDGTVASSGKFSDSRISRYFLRLIADSQIVTQLGLEWPVEGSDAQLEKFFAILNAYRKELGQRAPIRDFYFVNLAPLTAYTGRIGSLAKENGYNFLNLAGLDLEEMIGAEPRIPFDGHYTPPANFILSQKILSRIRQDHPEFR